MLEKIWKHYFKIQDSVRTGTPAGFTAAKRIFLVENYFIPLCKKLKIKKILDVGCALGASANYLRKKGLSTWGININKQQIKQSKSNRIKYGDMHDIPFDDKFFDAIYCSHTFEHSIAPYIALCEFNRILKKKGLVFIILPEEGDYWTTCWGHFFCPTIRQMLGLLHKAGFIDVRTWRSEWPFSALEVKKDLCFIWQKDIEWDEKKDDKLDLIPIEGRKLIISSGLAVETEFYIHKDKFEEKLLKAHRTKKKKYISKFGL